MRLHSKFEVAEAKNGRSRGHRNPGLTALEAGNSRSSDRPKIKILLINSYILIPKWPKTSKSDQNWKTFIHKHFRFSGILKIIQGLVIKVRQFRSDLEVLGHFGIRMYGLINKILISGQSDDLEFSASSTVRPGFRWPLDRPFLASATSNLACNLIWYPHS